MQTKQHSELSPKPQQTFSVNSKVQSKASPSNDRFQINRIHVGGKFMIDKIRIPCPKVGGLIQRKVRTKTNPIQKQPEMAKFLNQIKLKQNATANLKDKNVYVLIGCSGAGKSLLARLLLGDQFQLKNQAKDQQNQFKVKKKQNKAGKSVELVAKTNYFGIRIGDGVNPETVVPNVHKFLHGFVVDTAGTCCKNSWRDISNLISIENMLINARSVRLMVLLRQESIITDNGSKMRDELQQILNLANHLNQQNQQFFQSILGFITHATKDTKELIKFISKTAQETKQNRQLKLFLERFANSLKLKAKDSLKLASVQLLSTSSYINQGLRDNILEKLMEMDNIENPKQAFRLSMSKEMKNRLQMMALQQRDRIIQKAQQKRITELRLDFDIFIEFSELIKQKKIKEIYDETASSVGQLLLKQLDFANSLTEELMDLEKPISQEKIDFFYEAMENIKGMQQLRGYIPLFNERNVNSFDSNLSKKIQQALSTIETEKVFYGKDNQFYKKFAKVKEIRNAFGKQIPSLQQSFDTISKKFICLVEAQLNKCFQVIRNSQFQSLKTSLENLKDSAILLDLIFQLGVGHSIQIVIEELKQSLNRRIQEKIELISEQPTKTEICELCREYQYWLELRGIKELNELADELIAQSIRLLESSLLKICTEAIKKIVPSIKQSDVKAVQRSVEIVKEIRKSCKHVCRKTNDWELQSNECVNQAGRSKLSSTILLIDSDKDALHEIKSLRVFYKNLKKILEIVNKDLLPDQIKALKKDFSQQLIVQVKRTWLLMQNYWELDTISYQNKGSRSLQSAALQHFNRVNNALSFLFEFSPESKSIAGYFYQCKNKIQTQISAEMDSYKQTVQSYLESHEFNLHSVDFQNMMSLSLDFLSIKFICKKKIKKVLSRLVKMVHEYFLTCIKELNQTDVKEFNRVIQIHSTFSKCKQKLVSCLPRLSQKSLFQQLFETYDKEAQKKLKRFKDSLDQKSSLKKQDEIDLFTKYQSIFNLSKETATMITTEVIGQETEKQFQAATGRMQNQLATKLNQLQENSEETTLIQFQPDAEQKSESQDSWCWWSESDQYGE